MSRPPRACALLLRRGVRLLHAAVAAAAAAAAVAAVAASLLSMHSLGASEGPNR